MSRTVGSTGQDIGVQGRRWAAENCRGQVVTVGDYPLICVQNLQLFSVVSGIS